MAAARTALLDALDALRDQLDALVLIGAQAIYLWTGAADLAVAETTDDSDLAIDHRLLADDPLLEVAMTAAGFHRDPETRHFGSWLSPQNVPVDLMLPEAQSQKGGRRGARIPPHSNLPCAGRSDWKPRWSTTSRSSYGRSTLTTSASSRSRLRLRPPCWWPSSTSSANVTTPIRRGWTTRTLTTSTGCWSRSPPMIC